VGDEYLRQFAKAALEALGEHGNFYRMSGDEFVCIGDAGQIEFFVTAFNERIGALFDMEVPFLGVSIGYAKYPDDGDSLEKLILKADTIMYRVKNDQISAGMPKPKH
jgi:diguanylate cyclase (GGDEF)-like protein